MNFVGNILRESCSSHRGMFYCKWYQIFENVFFSRTSDDLHTDVESSRRIEYDGLRQVIFFEIGDQTHLSMEMEEPKKLSVPY